MQYIVIIIVYAIFFVIDFLPKKKAKNRKEMIFSGVLLSGSFILLNLTLLGFQKWNPIMFISTFLQKYAPF